MKPTSGVFVLSIFIFIFTISLPAPLNSAPQDQGQFATLPNSYTPRLWRNSDKNEDLKDVVFDFDTHESTSDQAILEANALWLKDHPNVRIRLAGYTDLRGDIVYNLLLSQKRAETVKQQLIDLVWLRVQSCSPPLWGELYPNCLESTEECWKQNRRVEFLRAIY